MDHDDRRWNTLLWLLKDVFIKNRARTWLLYELHFWKIRLPIISIWKLWRNISYHCTQHASIIFDHNLELLPLALLRFKNQLLRLKLASYLIRAFLIYYTMPPKRKRQSSDKSELVSRQPKRPKLELKNETKGKV